MKNVYIPDGKEGSINELAKKALSEPDNLVMEIWGKPKVCLNVISTLEEYGGAEAALWFAKKLIEWNLEV